MSMTYRTRRRLQKLGVTALIVLVVLLIAWFCSVIWLQRYVVYSADGAQVDFELGDAGFARRGRHTAPGPGRRVHLLQRGLRCH